jgi:uncharacterized protein (TIGR03000 family)
MLRPSVKKLLLVAVLTAAVVSLPAKPAQAGWGHHPAWWYDCCPSYVVRYPVRVVSCCDWCCDPCFDCCWSCCPGCQIFEKSCCGGGPVKSVEQAPQAQPGPKSQAPAGDDSVLRPKTGSLDRSLQLRTAVPSAPSTTRDLTSLAGSTAAGQIQIENSLGRTVPNGAVLTATVPAEASVYVNGVLTATTGTHRRYFSEGLLPGYRYDFRFEVVLGRNGQRLSDVQVVHVHAGDSVTLDFQLADQRVAQR